MEGVRFDGTPGPPQTIDCLKIAGEDWMTQISRGGTLSEEGFKRLFEDQLEKVSMKNTRSVYLFCNKACADHLRIPPTEIYGKSDYDFFPPDIASKHVENDLRILEGGEGESFDDIFKIPVKDEEGNVLGILCIEDGSCEGNTAEPITESLYSQEKPGGEINLELRECPLERSAIREDREGAFSPELMNDHIHSTDEHRQNIYRKILVMTVPQKIRLAVLGNRQARGILIHDPNRLVSLAVLQSPKITGNEILNFAKQKNISEEVLLTILRNKYWMKNYHIRLAIVGNPKTPFSEALKYLPYLQRKDLQDLSKNRNIPSSLRAGAHQILLKRNN